MEPDPGTLLGECYDETMSKIEAMPDGPIIQMSDIGRAWGLDGEDFAKMVTALCTGYLVGKETGVEDALQSMVALSMLTGIQYGRRHG